MSASTTPTFWPEAASAAARFTFPDALPTPPLPLATADTRVREARWANGSGGALGGRWGGYGGTDTAGPVVGGVMNSCYPRVGGTRGCRCPETERPRPWVRSRPLAQA